MGANTFVVPVEQIDVPDGRFRAAKPARVEEIASSFLRFGQLQPIILKPYQNGEGARRLELVDGLHRLCAAEANGATQIVGILRDDMDDLMVREVELEVNINREDMTWQERTAALVELDKIKQERDPNWTQSKTGEVAGVPRTRVAEAKKIEDVAKLFPEIKKAKSVAQALNMARSKAQSVLRRKEIADAPDEDYADIAENLWLGDSVELIKELPDEYCHAVITDPPFGIDYDKRQSDPTSYEDGKTKYERILTMAPDIYRVLKPNGWLVWFMGISWYEHVKGVFREAGFTVDEIPIIWDRSGGRTFSTNASRWFARGYDIALHCVKGSPELVMKAKHNVLKFDPVPTEEREQSVERPVELYRELIQRMTYPKEIVVDFFAGSGSCSAAAAETGRRWLAIEQDANRRAVALKKIRAHTGD